MTSDWKPGCYPRPSKVPPPPLDWGVTGWGNTYQYRLVPKWFGVKLEEMWRHQDGRAEWRKAEFPISSRRASTVEGAEVNVA